MTDIDTAREEWERVRQYRGPDKDKAADALITALTDRCEELDNALMAKDDDYWRPKLRLLQDDRAKAERRAEQAEAKVALLNREVRKWKSRRMVAEQKLGYEEKLRARAEADE
jgi:hypothetical protein